MNAQATVKAASRAASVQKVVGLKSGVEAWLVEDYAVPLIAFDMAFVGGGAQDDSARAGETAMLAALLDEGAGDMDADAFHRALDEKAVEISFSADRDHLQGRAKTLTRHLDSAAEFMRLAICEPRLDTDAIERVRSQMIAGLKREAQDPDAMAGKAWREAAYPNHPYGMAGHGTTESVPAITRDNLLAQRAAQMTRDGLKIAVVGAVDAAKLAGILDHVFAGLARKGSLKPIVNATMAGVGERHVVDLDVPQTTIRFGLPGVDRHDPDYWPAVVVNHVLGGGVFSARLFKEVREKRGLAYNVRSNLAVFDHSALFTGNVSTKNERAGESVDVIEEEIAKLCADGPSAEELEKAKKYLVGSYALQFDTSTKIAGNLAHLQCGGYDVSFLDERNERIAAVTMNDVLRVGKRLFDNKKLLVAAAGRPVGI